MIKRITVLLLLVVVSIAGCQEKKDIIDLSVAEFETRITKEDAYLLDVRTPGEVSEGIIEGANILDVMSTEFKENYTSIPKDKKIYIYCRSGNRSRKAVSYLKENGYEAVFHLDGGIKAWMRENKEIKTK